MLCVLSLTSLGLCAAEDIAFEGWEVTPPDSACATSPSSADSSSRASPKDPDVLRQPQGPRAGPLLTAPRPRTDAGLAGHPCHQRAQGCSHTGADLEEGRKGLSSPRQTNGSGVGPQWGHLVPVGSEVKTTAVEPNDVFNQHVSQTAEKPFLP